MWPKVAFTAGQMFMGGTNTNGIGQLWSFDVVGWVWTQYSSTIASFQAPDLLAWGGYVLAAGGAQDDQSNVLSYVPTDQGPAVAWAQVPVGGPQDAHDGHRLVTFGGMLYMVGGLDHQASGVNQWSNAMWQLDLLAIFTPGGTTSAWQLVQPINAPGVFSPRGAFSLDVIAGHITLFGGLTRDPTVTPPASGNVCQVTASCRVFNDMWVWSPGPRKGAPTANDCSGTNCGWTIVAPLTAAPPGRFGHASAALGSSLYIFGGVDASGNYLTDLWVYSDERNSWAVVPAQAGWTFPVQAWEPAATFVGHHLYVSMTGDAGGNAIYRWTPQPPGATPGGGPSGSANWSANNALYAAHTAGITMAVLLGVVNMAMLYSVLASNGSLPAWAPFQGGARAGAVKGYYASASADAGAYAPPA